MFAPFFFQGEAGPSPTPRDIIGKSLRFRGAQNLKRDNVASPNNPDVWTYSFWLKRGLLGTRQDFFDASNDSQADLLELFFDENDAFNISKMSSTGTESTSRYRDPSAWYHVVVQNDGIDLTAFINGDQIWQWIGNGGATGINKAGDEQCIGSENFTSGDGLFTEGYMADVYFIDGQALEPTAFGRYNDDGVWVPRKVDFTPAEMRYSDNVYVSTLPANWDSTDTSMPGGGAAANAFDGNLTTIASTGAANRMWIFRPSTAIEAQTSLRLFVETTGGTISQGHWVNQTQVSPVTSYSSDQWIDLGALGSLSFPLTIESIGCEGNASFAGGYVSAIEVDGEILTNPFTWSAQSYNSPAGAAPDFNSTNQTWESGFPITNGFDGSITTNASPPEVGGWSFLKPTTSIKNVTSLQIESQQLTDIWLNGVSVWNQVPAPVGVNGRTYDLTAALGGGVDVETIAVTTGSVAQYAWYVIWVNGQPLIDGVNSSYGANGFHLQFADPSNIGLDSSGNDNNFTATGFDLTPVGIFSDQLFTGADGSTGFVWNTTSKNFDPSAPAVYGFNNETNNVGTVANNSLVFRPNPPLTGVTEIAVEVDSSQGWQLGLNGADVNSLDAIGTAGYKRAQLPAGFNGTVTSFGLRNTVASNISAFSRIRINGTTVLVDNEGADYDLMQDSPTQNYATLSPLFAGTTVEPIDANLTVGVATTNPGSTIGIEPNSGKYYFEAELRYLVPSSGGRGIGLETNDVLNSSQSGLYNTTPGIWSAYTSNASSIGLINNGVQNTVSGSFLVQGDIMQIAYDSDTGNAWLGINNTFYDNTMTATIVGTNPTFTGIDKTVFMAAYVDTTGDTVPVNFGQKDGFIYNAPAGFTPLQSQNLPAAPIPDGRDNFQAIVGPGSGSSGTVLPGQRAGNWSVDLFAYNVNTAIPPFNTTNKDFYDGSGGGSATPAIQGFDGDTGTYAGCILPGTWIVWRPQGGIQVNSTITIEQKTGAPDWTLESVYINENLVASNDDGTVFNPTINFSGNLTNLAIRGLVDNYTASISRILVDGEVLVDANILSIAQQTFPKGLYWIKDLQNVNQWQFVSFMTGLGADGGVYSDFLTASTPIYSGQEISNIYAFDGNTTNYVQVGNPGPLTFAPEPPIVFNQSLEVFTVMLGFGSITFDGTTVSPTVVDDYTLVATSGTISSSNPLIVTGDGSANATIAAIKVDGQILVDVYSQALTASGGWSTTYTAAQGFDGSVSTYCQSNNVDTPGTFAPVPSVPFTSKLEIFQEFNGDNATWNGNSTSDTSGGGGWHTIYEGSGEISATLPITVNNSQPNNTVGFNAIKVDGQILVDAGTAQALQSPAGGALAPYVPPSGNSIAYCWNSVNDPVINTNGTTPSRVSADPESGFSIVKYKGTGTNSTIGHGLNTAPELVIYKKTNGTNDFGVYAKPLTPSYYLRLNTTAAQQSASTTFNETAPNATVLSTGGNDLTNNLNDTYVAYCFAPVPGYSSIGTYDGNQNADGPFIYTGFKPAFIMIKGVNVGGSWFVYDSTRSPYNPADKTLNTDGTGAETVASYTNIDFLSNGFKIRTDNASFNQGYEYLYLAFASNPFGADNTSPVTAY